VLKNIHISVEAGKITFTTTNLELGVQHTVRGKTEEDGSCLVPAKLFLDLVSLLPEGTVTVTLEESGLRIATADTSSSLHTIPEADFPIIPSLENPKNEVEFLISDFVEGLKKTQFSVGRNEQRPQFQGVLLVLDGQTVCFAATDGFRLAEAKGKIATQEGRVQCIVPTSAAQEIFRMLGSLSGSVKMALGENQACFLFDQTVVTTRLVEGDFPEYESLFPVGGTEHVVAVSALSKAVKATALFSRGGSSSIGVTGNADGSLDVHAESSEVGFHRTKVPATGPAGTGESITLNARYLLDILAVADGKVVVHLLNADRPVLVTPYEAAEGNNWRYLIMPIRG